MRKTRIFQFEKEQIFQFGKWKLRNGRGASARGGKNKQIRPRDRARSKRALYVCISNTVYGGFCYNLVDSIKHTEDLLVGTSRTIRISCPYFTLFVKHCHYGS